MPTEYRPSGPEITRNNQTVVPEAPIYFCETCNFEGAAFGQIVAGERRSYCGWRDGAPVCVGRSKP